MAGRRQAHHHQHQRQPQQQQQQRQQPQQLAAATDDKQRRQRTLAQDGIRDGVPQSACVIAPIAESQEDSEEETGR